ncbi:MAG: RHS repeat-associated core domain-containing protein [Saprospiraceae bacterium]|nr:RHS repeat-associated core domain-containing protein [Saprospiraceae bacterium]
MDAIYHAEGRCTPNGATAFHYEYTLKDHLGNARVNFRANGAAVTFLEEMHYYPFGMQMEGMGTQNPANKYLYNGKELNDDLGLNWSDYGARWYDAALGRWWSVDPLAVKMPNWAVYNYAFNNPLRFIDPNGAQPGDPEKLKQAAKNAVSTVTTNDPSGSLPARCNVGVSAAFKELTGSDELSSMRANQMIDYMKSSSNFTEVTIDQVQELANQGEIVVAGYQSSSYLKNKSLLDDQQKPDSEISSGHVALAVPGEALKSGGTWNGQKSKDMEGGIPNLMDTGRDMRAESQPANQSFGKGKQGDVKFFHYIGGGTPEPPVNDSNPVSLPQATVTSTRTFPKGTSIIRYYATDKRN